MSKGRERDGRLLIALLLLVTGIAALTAQAWISMLYFHSAIAQNWSYYLDIFPSFALPPLPPGAYCMDDCNPRHPVAPGWIGGICLVVGVIVIAISWWNPRAVAMSPNNSFERTREG